MSGKGAKGLSGKHKAEYRIGDFQVHHADLSSRQSSSGKGAKGTMGMDKKLLDKKKPTSRSSRAGLQFPVGRVHRLLKVPGYVV